MIALLTREAPSITQTGRNSCLTVAIARILDGLYAMVAGESDPRRIQLSPVNVDVSRLAATLFLELGTGISRIILVGTTSGNLSGWDDFTEAELAKALSGYEINAEVIACSEASALRTFHDYGSGCTYLIFDYTRCAAKWFTPASDTLFTALDVSILLEMQRPYGKNWGARIANAAAVLLARSPQIQHLVLWSHQGWEPEQIGTFFGAIGSGAWVSVQPRLTRISILNEARSVLLGAVQL